MRRFHLVTRLLCASLVLTPALAGAIQYTGKVSDLTGNPLAGICVSLSVSDTTTRTDLTGAWSLSGNSSAILPRTLESQKMTKHLILENNHVRVQFKGVDGLGRFRESARPEGQFSSPVSLARTAAAEDSLEFSWNGRVRARIAAATFVSGNTLKIDTSAASPVIACNTHSCRVCGDTDVVTNLVKNSTFDGTMLPWVKILEASAAMTPTVVNGELNLRITNGAGAPWNVMLQHKNLSLVADKVYLVKVDARALAPFKLVINIQSAPDPPDLYAAKSFNLTTTMKSFSFDFVAPATDPTAVWQFNLGNQGPATVILDNIQLIEEAP